MEKELTIKINKGSFGHIWAVVGILLLVFVGYLIFNGTIGSDTDAQKEVEKLITYELEDQFGIDGVTNIGFSDVEVKTSENRKKYYSVTGIAHYDEPNNGNPLYNEFNFTYTIQYTDGEWIVINKDYSR